MRGPFSRLHRHAGCVVLLGHLLGTAAQGAAGDPDEFGLTWATSVDEGCATALPDFGAASMAFPAATDVVGPFALSFPYDFLGRAVTELHVSPTGYVTFSDQGPASGTRAAPPNAMVPNDLLAAFWFAAPEADLTIEGSAELFHVRWQQATDGLPGEPRTDVHLVLRPGSRAELWWVEDGGRSAVTIGYENADGTAGRHLYSNPLNREDGFPLPRSGSRACIRPAPKLDCSRPVELACGVPTTIALGGASAGHADYHGCSSEHLPASERLVSLTLDVFADVTLVATGPDPRIVSLRPPPECSEWRCLAAAGDRLRLPGRPGTHWFLIDSPLAAGGEVELTATCEPVGEPVSCGDIVMDSTAGEGLFEQPDCAAPLLRGPERSYRLVLPADMDVSLELSASAPGQWVSLHDGPDFDATGSSCMASARDGLAVNGLPAGEYVVLVDGETDVAGPFTLEVSCSVPDLDCSGLAELRCEEEVTSDTSGLESRIDAYPCSTRPFTGGELAFIFKNPVDQQVRFELDGVPGQSVVVVEDGCEPVRCIASPLAGSCRTFPRGHHVVVVDGTFGAEGPFRLVARCGRSALGRDLTLASVEARDVRGDCGGLEVSGSVAAVVANLGDAAVETAFEVSAFIDVDGDDLLGPADVVLGTTVVPGPLPSGTTTEVSIAVAGTLDFRDQALHVMVDADDDIVESDETNNVADTGTACRLSLDGTFDPVVAWTWAGSDVMPDFRRVFSTPVVADLDGDTRPEVIFSTLRPGSEEAIVRAISGRDGSPVWSATAPSTRVEGGVQLAVGDLDGDGRPEIVGQSHEDPARLVALTSTGDFAWRSERIIGSAIGMGRGGAAIADLDGDGISEVVWGKHVVRADGSPYWTPEAGGTEGSGAAFNDWSLSVAADLDGDGRVEVVAGPTAYRDAFGLGEIAWQQPAVADGYPAILDVDSDGVPEIAIATSDKTLALLSGLDGSLLWESWLPSGVSSPDCEFSVLTAGGPPSVADFDGDCAPEIAVSNNAWVTLFESDGTMKWKFPLPGCNPSFSASVFAFDFDGDGAKEVVLIDGGALRVLSGAEGRELFVTPASLRQGLEMPIVADVDGDDDAEIVVPLTEPGGLRVYEDGGDGWVRTRRIWNQHSYHVTNVSDDGTVPRNEEPSWTEHGTYRTQLSDDQLAAPDLSVSILSADVHLLPDCSRQLELLLRFGNGGSARAGRSFSVRLFDGEPDGGGDLLYEEMIADLDRGEYRDVIFDVPLAALGTRTIVALVDPEGAVTECRDDNNRCEILVDNPEEGIDRPDDVGDVLFATGHGDPHAPEATGSFEWSGDEGGPRLATEHYHIEVGDSPQRLALDPDMEGWTETSYVDVTPAAVILPAVRYIRIRAADDCEQVSRR